MWIWEINEYFKKIFRKTIHPCKHVIWSQICIPALAFFYFWETCVSEFAPHISFLLTLGIDFKKGRERWVKPSPFLVQHHSPVRLTLWIRIVATPSLNAIVSCWLAEYLNFGIQLYVLTLISLLIFTTHSIYPYKSGCKETVVLP